MYVHSKRHYLTQIAKKNTVFEKSFISSAHLVVVHEVTMQQIMIIVAVYIVAILLFLLFSLCIFEYDSYDCNVM